MSRDFAIRSSRVVTHEGMKKAAVIVKNGIIADVTDFQNVPKQIAAEDAGDLEFSHPGPGADIVRCPFRRRKP